LYLQAESQKESASISGKAVIVSIPGSARDGFGHEPPPCFFHSQKADVVLDRVVYTPCGQRNVGFDFEGRWCLQKRDATAAQVRSIIRRIQWTLPQMGIGRLLTFWAGDKVLANRA
jgi:hypothetical protein